jgi:charged multivesicular body protein 3
LEDEATHKAARAWAGHEAGPASRGLRATVTDLTFHQLEATSKKTKQQVKQLATKGDVKSARILAREVVRADKQVDRLSVSKAQLGSIDSQLQQQLGELVAIWKRCERSWTLSYTAMAKVTGTLQKSTEIMKMSNQLVRLPQFSQTMRDMSMEMTKVGSSVLQEV